MLASPVAGNPAHDTADHAANDAAYGCPDAGDDRPDRGAGHSPAFGPGPRSTPAAGNARDRFAGMDADPVAIL